MIEREISSVTDFFAAIRIDQKDRPGTIWLHLLFSESLPPMTDLILTDRRRRFDSFRGRWTLEG